jgi:bacillithiol biosynthesis deacetylase BshB1
MNILAFGIHPDDVELGCGGTLVRSCNRGDTVTIVDLTRGESASNGTSEGRAVEAAAAAEILGCQDRLNLAIPDAGVQSEDPDQQRLVVATIRSLRPDLILVSNEDDQHPDHSSGTRLITRSMYLAGIHGYKTAPVAAEAGVWKVRQALIYSGRRDVRIDVVVDITEVHEIKMQAAAAHESQFQANADSKSTPLNEEGFMELVRARDRVHGARIGVRYGEGFSLFEPLGVQDLEIFRSIAR